MSSDALELRAVRKSYAPKVVFDETTLRLSPGIYAVVGPNGSGKSTLLELIAGARPLDCGDVRLFGTSLCDEPYRYKSMLGFVPDEPCIFPFMTGREFVRFIGAARGIPPSAFGHPIESQGLAPFLDIRFSGMSLGTQRKFFLAAALAPKPLALIMDEPTSALDSASLGWLTDLVRRRVNGELTVFSTHDASFVDRVGAAVIQIQVGEHGASLSLSSGRVPGE